MMKKRELTTVELRECEALKDIYMHKRRELKLSQEQIGERLGITQSGVSMYLSGRNALNLQIARGFARILGVTIASFSPRLAREWMKIFRDVAAIGAQGPQEEPPNLPGIEPNAERIGDLPVRDAEDELDQDEVEVPYYDQVEFAGGNGMSEVVEVTDRQLRFSRITLRAAGVDPSAAAVARLRGRSMERLILDGSAIGFDRSCTDIIDGEIFAFNQEGMLRVKYLYRLPAGAVRIRSENSTEYPDEVITADQFAHHVIMLGRVFWWSTVRRAPRA